MASAVPPVVSLTRLRDPRTQRHEVVTLDTACRDIGFFVLVDHGVDRELGLLFDAAQGFFALPQATKERIARVDRYGFVPASGLATPEALAAGRLTGNNEYIDLGLHDEVPLEEVLLGHDCELAARVAGYLPAALDVSDTVLRALADGLAIDASFFADRMTDPQCRLRLLHYPPTPLAADGSRAVPTTPHTDYGAITLLATDGVPGLEVKPVGRNWTPVEAPAGALVVNLGDMLARWTGHTYVSTPHRVVGSPDQHRYSIPFFVNPDPATMIETIGACIDPHATLQYEPVSAGDFLAARIDGVSEPYLSEPYVDPTEGPKRSGIS